MCFITSGCVCCFLVPYFHGPEASLLKYAARKSSVVTFARCPYCAQKSGCHVFSLSWYERCDLRTAPTPFEPLRAGSAGSLGRPCRDHQNHHQTSKDGMNSCMCEHPLDTSAPKSPTISSWVSIFNGNCSKMWAKITRDEIQVDRTKHWKLYHYSGSNY